jgi:flagellin
MLRVTAAASTAGVIRHMNRTTSDISSSLKELATGSRLETASNKASDRAIAEQIEAEYRGYDAAAKNTQVGSSFVQIAEGSLNEQNNILIRMRELAIQASGDSFKDSARAYADLEFQQLVQEFDRIAKSSKGQSSLSLNGDSKNYEFQVGMKKGSENQIRFTNNVNTTASGVGISGTSIADSDDAQDALDDIDSALHEVAYARAEMGAVQARLDTVDSHLQTQSVALKETYSKYADADVATAVSKLRSAQVVQQYQIAALQAVNDTQALGMKLIA